MATGENSGTWGTKTNTNLELIGEAFSMGTENLGSDANATITLADGSTDEARSFYLKITSTTLTATREVTLAPNTVSKIWIIENATTGSQSITIKQGSGATVTIPNGGVKAVVTDGAGSGAAVLDVFTDLSVAGSFTTGASVTVGSGAEEDTKIVFDGNAQDFYIGLDDSADDLVIGKGSAVGTTPAVEIDENLDIKFAESIGVGQAASSTTGDIVAQTMSLKGTTPSLTIGDGGEEDTKLVYDGNAKDFYMGLDDSADKLVVGVGSTVGTNSILTLDDDSVTVGDGAEVDTKVVFDGNAQDYYIGLDDSADSLLVGSGSTVGTTPAITIDQNQTVTFSKSAVGSTLTDTSNSGNVTLDFQANQNFVLTLTGNVTLDNPSTEAVGQSGIMVFIQDGTGSRTLSLGTDYETAGGAGITLSTTASAVDVVPYFVKAAGSIQLGAPQKAFA
tara:strand:+ start:390 stop:1733 length:1344 start_codon:yes stop_codon:yes gene_type:complete